MPKLADHPAFAPSVLVVVSLAALTFAFNLGSQYTRQDRIAEITADLKHRETVLPADSMAREYEIARHRLDRMDAMLSAGAAKDAEINGHIENLTGKLESVWTRQAQDQRDISDIRASQGARISALEARLEMLIRQVSIHDEHDFQSERGEAHPK